jgi:hypothetical protein
MPTVSASLLFLNNLFKSIQVETIPLHMYIGHIAGPFFNFYNILPKLLFQSRVRRQRRFPRPRSARRGCWTSRRRRPRARATEEGVLPLQVRIHVGGDRFCRHVGHNTIYFPVFYLRVDNPFRIDCSTIRNKESERCGILFYVRSRTPLSEWCRFYWHPILRMKFHPCPSLFFLRRPVAFFYFI